MEHFTQTHTKTKGFTMIEMLAVIAIIGILSSIALPNLSGAREKARDSERVTEVSQIVLAIELFYNACRRYPVSPLVVGDTGSGCPTGVTLASFLSDIPKDPLDPTRVYTYARTATSFVVKAHLEKSNTALTNDIDGVLTGLGGTDCGTTVNEAASGPYYFCKGS